MNGMMTENIRKLKQLVNEKGQGLVEFGLLCAFCVALGFAMRDVGFAEAIDKSLDKSTPELLSAAIEQKDDTTYLYYFEKWRSLSSSEVKKENNLKRIEADQKALIKLAETYLGRTENDVLNLMHYYTNSWEQNKEPDFIDKFQCSTPGGTGFSGILNPLEFNVNKLDTEDWISFKANNNQNTIKYLTGGEATIYDKYDTHNPTYNQGTRRTVTTDRVFYSDSIINSNELTVSVKLHYTDGKVDKVAIAARNGGWNSNAESIGKDLCLLVTKAGNEVVQAKKNQKDIIRADASVYADVWNVN